MRSRSWDVGVGHGIDDGRPALGRRDACPASKPGHHEHHAMGLPCHMLKGLNLTDDQKAKVKALNEGV